MKFLITCAKKKGSTRSCYLRSDCNYSLIDNIVGLFLCRRSILNLWRLKIISMLHTFLTIWLLGYKRELGNQIGRILKKDWSHSRGRKFGHWTTSQIKNLCFGGCTGLRLQMEKEKGRTNAGGLVINTRLNPCRELRPQKILFSSLSNWKRRQIQTPKRCEFLNCSDKQCL